ncbi:MAG: Mur ligase family protein [bacterium]|nr:Mur ligase family protein [bacterium]
MTNHIHIIGICGVGTSALAVALKTAGYKVTGSDKGFFPPVSNALKEAGVEFWAGWHPERMKTKDTTPSVRTDTPPQRGGVEQGGNERVGTPDLVVAGGGGTSESNPEIIFAKEKNIPILSFAEAVGKFIVKNESVVVAGTWGKTTSSALLSFILEYAGVNPNYFFGGLSLSHASGKITGSDLSVVEGDEYQAAIWDKKPKFAYYKPTRLLLTAVSWDHADMYETEDSYFETFQNLVNSIPDKKNILANIDDPGVKKVIEGSQVTSYGKSSDSTYRYENVRQDKNGLTFEIVHNNTAHRINSPMIGLYNAENITGAFAMAREIGIEPETIKKALAEFKGLKRRLEKRYANDIVIIDDIAHSPSKARFTLAELRSIYGNSKIIAIFEPNIGGREKMAKKTYDDAFKDADLVIIPRLTKQKISPEKEAPMGGAELAHTISKTLVNTKYIEKDEEVIQYIKANIRKGDVVSFLGSHGFRGMIEETVRQIKDS